MSYQEGVTNDPGRCIAAGLHLKECTNTLRVRQLCEFEVIGAYRPGRSTKGDCDVDSSGASCNKYTVRLEGSLCNSR